MNEVCRRLKVGSRWDADRNPGNRARYVLEAIVGLAAREIPDISSKPSDPDQALGAEAVLEPIPEPTPEPTPEQVPVQVQEQATEPAAEVKTITKETSSAVKPAPFKSEVEIAAGDAIISEAGSWDSGNVHRSASDYDFSHVYITPPGSPTWLAGDGKDDGALENAAKERPHAALGYGMSRWAPPATLNALGYKPVPSNTREVTSTPMATAASSAWATSPERSSSESGRIKAPEGAGSTKPAKATPPHLRRKAQPSHPTKNDAAPGPSTQELRKRIEIAKQELNDSEQKLERSKQKVRKCKVDAGECRGSYDDLVAELLRLV
jgi:hypothetical protein